VCPPRHHVYIVFLSLGVMSRVFTTLHLPVTHNDNLTRHIQFAMITIDLLHTHIIFCKSSQLIIR